MASATAVDAAVFNLVASDPTLMALAPDGVFFDLAPEGKTKFVLVTMVDENDEPMFGGRAAETYFYTIKHVELADDSADGAAAEARIDAIFEQQPLSISGYAHTLTRRDGRIRYTEDDEIGLTRWHHRGGRYELHVSPVS